MSHKNLYARLHLDFSIPLLGKTKLTKKKKTKNATNVLY